MLIALTSEKNGKTSQNTVITRNRPVFTLTES